MDTSWSMGLMGNVIQFPIKKLIEDEQLARLRRIQESLRKINELMRKLKNEREFID